MVYQDESEITYIVPRRYDENMKQANYCRNAKTEG